MCLSYSTSFKSTFPVLVLLILSSCGGVGSNGTGTTFFEPANAIDDGTNIQQVSEPPQQTAEPQQQATEPQQQVAEPLQLAPQPQQQTPEPQQQYPETQTAPANDSFPYSGVFVVDEYSPSIVSPQFEGIVEINPTPLSKTRLFNGNLPRRYADGRTTYREGCGQRVSRIVLAERNGISTPITPCSSEVANEGASPTDFRQSNLSPDGTKIAVETRIYINSGYSYSTLVFDVASQEVLATARGGYNGTWTPDGRLLLASDEGLFLLDAYLDNPVQIGSTINGPVGNPDVDPSGTVIAFEYNQQIWGINIDGSDAKQLLTDGSRLRFPVWNPDGSASLAYLAVPSDDKYYGYIFAANFENGQAYGLDLAPVLEFGSSNFLRTINGPLSWNK